MEIYKNEPENRDYLLKKIKDKIETEIAKYDCFVDKEIPVPYKHIYIPVRNSLEIWCFKQDICIYSKLFDKTTETKRLTINSSGESILNIHLEKNASKDKDVGMPFVIVETKMADVKTEDILATSEKIKMIKSIFPYCKAYLLVFDSPRSSVYRLYSGFDEILFMTNLDDKQCDDIINKIKDGFNLGYGNIPFVVSYNYP
jgi:hypothetical protein